MEYVELRIFAETTIFYAGLFLKNILYFAKRILSKRSRKFFNIRTKPHGLNHPGISAVSHWFFLFQKQLLDFPSTIAHGSTARPFKTHFSKASLFLENKTLIAIPYQTHPFLWTQTIRIGFQTLHRGVHFTH
jgi:hypothetical protein